MNDSELLVENLIECQWQQIPKQTRRGKGDCLHVHWGISIFFFCRIENCQVDSCISSDIYGFYGPKLDSI